MKNRDLVWWLLTVLVFGCVCAAADEILVVAKSGYYVLETDAAGAPKLTPIASRFKQVVVLDTTPPVPPTPDTLTERAAAIRDRAVSIVDPARAETAQELALLYSEIAKKVRAGEIKTQATIAEVVKGVTDTLLNRKGVAGEWSYIRLLMSEMWVKLVQEGATDAAYAQLLDDAATGLRASAPAAEARAIDIAKILEILRIVMELLQLIPREGSFR